MAEGYHDGPRWLDRPSWACDSCAYGPVLREEVMREHVKRHKPRKTLSAALLDAKGNKAVIETPAPAPPSIPRTDPTVSNTGPDQSPASGDGHEESDTR